MSGKTSPTTASFKTVLRATAGVCILAAVTGCSTPDLGAAGRAEAQATVTPVVQAYCPQVVIRTDTGFHRAYAGKAAEGDDSKLIYQASFADVTRSCTANETTLTVNVMAQGRIVAGAAGKTGDVTLPVLVEAVDGNDVIYSQKVAFTATIPAEGSGQFIFQKPDVAIPNAVGGASRFTTVRIGFDTGKAAAKKPARRG
ncbi:PilZ domain-containing protein [Neorhizobium sp. NPDC001467]|uniref:PilZ domain-containing protein n=1 Tax=Neorhizobium sp. NPDC001467 TaxID=3390595 RepID=UPI003D01386A